MLPHVSGVRTCRSTSLRTFGFSLREQIRVGWSQSVKSVFAAALFCFAASPALLGAEGPVPSKAISVPPLPFKHMTLPNGLQVYTVEDHKSPTVAVQVWYHVGSKDDPNGRSGFAHLFEHMMFKDRKSVV